MWLGVGKVEALGIIYGSVSSKAPKGPVREFVVSFLPFRHLCFYFVFLITLKANYAYYRKQKSKVRQTKTIKA